MNLVHEVFGDSIMERLGWVLLHSLWQIALIAAIFAVVLRVFSRVSAERRYFAGCMALLLMIAIPTATFLAQPLASAVEATEPSDLTNSGVSLALVGSDFDSHAREAKSGVSLAPVSLAPVGNEATVGESLGGEPGHGIIDITKTSISLVEQVRSVLPGLVVCWLIGVVTLLTRPALGYYATLRMRTVGVQPEIFRPLPTQRSNHQKRGQQLTTLRLMN